MNIESIRHVPLFAGLSDEELSLLSQAFQREEFQSGATVFAKGTPSQALHLIEEGFVRLVAGDPDDPQAIALATLGPGSLLGEAEFLRGAAHTVSGLAASDAVLLSLSDQALRELIQRHPHIGVKLSQNFGALPVQMEAYLAQKLAATQALGELPNAVLREMARRLRPRQLAPGEALYRTGEPSQGLFLVESGSLTLLPDGSGPEADARQVGPGEILGVLSLLTSKPYARTAQAQDETLVWNLSPEDFNQISAQHPSLRRILGRRIQGRLSPADQTQAVIRLAKTAIFADLPAQTLHAIAQRLTLQHVPAGETIYRMGESGDALYLVEEGEIELTAENASGVVEELARVRDGGVFGEMSLLTGKNRTEDATAVRDTNLWIFYKADLDELIGQYPSIGAALNRAVEERLSAQQSTVDEARYRRFPLLAHLSSQDLQEVAQHMRPTRFRAGEQIYRAGTPGDQMYFIEAGHVRMQPLTGQGWIIGEGEIFSERAALTNQLRGQSAIAETDVDLFSISREDLEALMLRLPTLAVSLSRFLSERMAEPANAAPQMDPTQPARTGAMTLSAQRRRAAASRPMPPAQSRPGFGEWFAGLSTGAKVRLVLLVLLVVYLIGVAAPMAVRALFSGAPAGVEAPVVASDALVAADLSQGVAVASAGLEAVNLGVSAVQPTATYTPFPTDTPVPTPTPTITPTPTNTPTPLPTATPTHTPPPPPPAPAQAEVQAASAPPAEPPRAWDPRLDQLGVRVAEAQVASGQPYWRLIEAKWENEQEAGGKHHIYVEVLDENGQRIVGQPLTVFWSDGGDTLVTEDKPAPEYAFNYPMYKAGNSYNVRIEGLPSDVVEGMGLGTPDLRFYTVHTVFRLIFQKTIKP